MTRNLKLPCRASMLAIAAALAAGPSPAAAQSLLGTPTVSSGSANISEGAGTTNVTIDSSQAVIDWTPDDNLVGNFGAIAFQNSGTTATFSSTGDFAVLNRVNVADNNRQIFMNGTINGIVGQQAGGDIYFYSPSGFVIGSNAVINVGSLVLTSRPITVDGQGNFINNGVVTFGAVADPFGNPLNPSAGITTVAGSQINALAGSSYVALVAPRVEHHGTISVDGSAALVGAEAATMTFRTSGLFDIQVDFGTTDGNGVVIDGTITGPASSGVGDNHRIYAVAVPKNNAMTMLISSGANLGFDVAQAADVVGNTVVLSAGHDVFFGGAEFDPSAASGGAASINILNSTFTSAMSADATGNIDLGSTAGQTTKLYSDADLNSSGGYIQVETVGSDALVDIDGNLSLVTDRFGQSNGQSVTAGQAAVYSQAGGTMNVDGNLNISANGYGGNSFVGGVDAGDGTGGQVQVQAEAGSSLSIGGNIFATADGFGGYPGAAGVNAGDGNGGYIFIGTLGDSASLGIGSTVTATASGMGGAGDGGECFLCDGLGGLGTGGDIFAGTTNGTNSTAYFGDAVDLRADGSGGRSVQAGSSSATGTGGSVTIFSSGGSQVEGFGTTFASDVTLSASGQGGQSFTPGIAAGRGDGGSVTVLATANSTLGIIGDLEVDADGAGGFNDFDVDGGDGQGGGVFVSAQGGNALIDVAGTADLEADGDGSVANSDCIGCGGIGGDGAGGTAQIYSGGGSGNNIVFGSALDLSAEGYGGIGGNGNAGTGSGGTASINVGPGLSVDIGGGLAIEANGTGGYGYNGNNAGAGSGGTAAVYGNGGSLSVTGDTFLESGGYGGGTGIVSGGNGGIGTGGTAQVYAPSGTINFTGSLFADAEGEGGDAAGGIGGNGLGGTAAVQSDGGSIHVTGNLFLNGGAVGGDGTTGGSAIGLVSPPDNEAQQTAVMVTTHDGGSIDVDGIAALSAEAVGGNGSNGNGGLAQAGEADVVAFFGSIDLGSLAISTNAYGGSGGNGGNGGNANGGPVDVTFGLGPAAIGGTITLGSATITADGEGGDGGSGTNGATGGTGGLGGAGSGGRILFAGSAGGGTLNGGTVILTSLGRGGDGGTGGTGDTGSGGAGGAGGTGTANAIQTGTISAEAAPTVGGGMAVTSLYADASAYGGDGGDGGTGAGGDGAGGNGGVAFGGNANFLARGVLVTANTVNLNANATGGNGGLGSTQGNGGNATTGAIQVESKDRFGHPSQRGTLQVGSVVGSAIAVGGTGATDGTASVIGSSYFRVLNGDADIGSFDFTIDGDVYDNTFANSTVSVRDGVATVGDFSFTIAGVLALDASNGSMTASGNINLAADTFVADTFSGAQVGPGTYSADSFSITTGGDFITNANLDSASALSLLAPGLISAANISSDASVFARANGTLSAGTIGAASFIDLRSNGLMSVNTLNAGDYIDLRTANGIQMADATSGETIYILTGGLLTGGNLTAGNTVAAQGALGITLGDLSAGIVNPSSASGALYRVGLGSNGAINVGNIIAAGDIGMGTPGSATTGSMTSGGGILALVSGSMQFGSMTTNADGYVYLADNSMAALGGTFDNFDRAPVLAATPVRSGGSIAIGGAVSTGLFQAAAGTTLTTQSIAAPDGIYLDAGGAIITGALSSDEDLEADSDVSIQTGDINLILGSLVLGANGNVTTGAISVADGVQLTSDAGNIATGNINAPGQVDLDAGGSISFGNVVADDFNFESGGSVTGGNITATSHADGEAEGAIIIGDVLVNGPPSTGDFSVGFTSATSIETGDVSGFDKVGFATFGNLTTGNLSAGNLVMTLVGGDIATGSITTTQQNGQVYMADASMFETGGGGPDSDFDETIVLALDPVQTGGSINIAGPVSTTLFRAASGGDFTAGDISAFGFFDEVMFQQGVQVRAGGTAVLNGTWAGESVDVTSNDIDITSDGGINAGNVALASTNATRTIIGDGVDGTGYRLSDAEYDRIDAPGGEIEVGVNGSLGGAKTMIIGDLSISANAETAEEYEFATYDTDSEEGSGSIRLVGDMLVTGADGHDVSFTTGTFELDAATGLLALTGSGSQLAGDLDIQAVHIHVAEGDILDQLADNPQYDGYQDDLNAPATVQRPDGVIRAGNMNIDFDGAGQGELYTLYVQNTGTADVPAGFVVSNADLGDEIEGQGAPGSIDIVINGQIDTGEGLLTGVDVRDALVANRDLAPFTDNSTVNGCLLTGGCGGGGSSPLPPDFTPTPGIQQEITLLGEDPLPPPPFGNEEFIDDNDSDTDEAETSPIVPPQPLFDTSELGEADNSPANPKFGTQMRSSPGLTETGDVDDPVSGSGNPALMETPPPDSGQEKQP